MLQISSDSCTTRLVLRPHLPPSGALNEIEERRPGIFVVGLCIRRKLRHVVVAQ